MHMCLVYFPKHFILEFVLLNDNKIELVTGINKHRK